MSDTAIYNIYFTHSFFCAVLSVLCFGQSVYFLPEWQINMYIIIIKITRIVTKTVGLFLQDGCILLQP